MVQEKKRDVVVDINTLYACLEAFVVQFKAGSEKYGNALKNFDFFNSLQTKVLRTGVLNDDGSERNREELDSEEFDKDIPMAWFTLITKAIFGLFLLSKISESVAVTSKEMQSANGDTFRINEVSIPCPRLGYENYVITSKVDNPNNKLLKIGGVFINGELAIKAPYDMQEYVETMIEIDKANGVG